MVKGYYSVKLVNKLIFKITAGDENGLYVEL